MYKQLIFIFLGGGFGSVFRFLVSQYTAKLWSINYFPLGTFVVNVSLEGMLFLQTGNYGQFLLYTIASLVVGILFVWLGNIIYS